MFVFATFNDEGFPTGFYPEDIYPLGSEIVPNNAEAVSVAQWQEFIDHQGLRKYVDGEVVEYIPPPPEPVNATTVSDRQFIQALAEAQYKIITWDEAHAWGFRGELPKLLTDRLDLIVDDDTRNRAYMMLGSAKQFEIDHPTTLAVAGMLGWDRAALVGLWNFANTL